VENFLEFGTNIWTVEGRRIRFYTIPFETRMTIVKLESGGLWILSPIRPSQDVFDAVRALGPVQFLIVPNLIHCAYTTEWQKEFPEASTWVSPRTPKRHPNLQFNGLLADGERPPWDTEIERVFFSGNSFLDETVFLHKESKTLIVTDLIQRHDPEKESAFWRIVKDWTGVLFPNGGVARDIRFNFRDRQAALESYHRIMGWEFDRMIIAHGACIESGAKEYFKTAFEWLVK